MVRGPNPQRKAGVMRVRYRRDFSPKIAAHDPSRGAGPSAFHFASRLAGIVRYSVQAPVSGHSGLSDRLNPSDRSAPGVLNGGSWEKRPGSGTTWMRARSGRCLFAMIDFLTSLGLFRLRRLRSTLVEETSKRVEHSMGPYLDGEETDQCCYKLRIRLCNNGRSACGRKILPTPCFGEGTLPKLSATASETAQTVK